MEQKIIFITGASSGIGYAAARKFVAAGEKVYAAARRSEMMKTLEKEGGKIIELDVTKDADLQAAVDKILTKETKIDTLIVAAGYGQLGPVEIVTDREAKDQFETNLFSAAATIRAVLPAMKKAGQGKIIVISSGVGEITMPGMAWYAASKHALDALINSLRLEMRDFGIQVAIIEPTYTNTPFLETALRTWDKVDKRLDDPIYHRQQRKLRENFTSLIERGASAASVADLIAQASDAPRLKRYYRAPQINFALFLKRLGGYVLLDRLILRKTIK